ncbi:MAG: hypothetical protein GY854_27005 [Deltaproteobacteria bacterium]|nr:hypothetical protein [Deltaproteobacteria bacterium]
MAENCAERVKWIKHQGKKILYCDYSKLRGPAYIEHVEYQLSLVREDLKTKPPKMLVVIDASNAVTDKTIKKMAQSTFDLAKEAGAEYLVAVLGVTRVIRILAQAINKDMYFAKDKEDALDWLAKQ